MKVRDLIRALRDAGATPDRVTGSHQIWKTSVGTTVVVTVNHLNADACPQSMKAAKRAGIRL